MKLALHSVGYSGVWGSGTVKALSEFLRKAAELGFDGVELMGKRPHVSPLDFSRDRLRALRDEIGSLNLELCCIASYHDFSPQPDHPDMAQTEKELLYLREALRMANALECPLVRVYSGYRRSTVPFESHWESCVRALKESCKMAEDFDVCIGLQNHSPVSSYLSEVLRMVEEIGSDRLKVVLDAPLLAERGEDLREAVLRCGDLIAHSHTSDFRYVYGREPGDYFTFRRVVAVPMGKGAVDYPAFVGALREIDYDGYLSYEMCCRLEGGGSEENLDRLAAHALRYTRDLISRA
jgi:sugar phosphate isomerase/epimerase